MILTQQDISNVIATIVQGYAPVKIYLFGSYVAGNVRNSSDLDLLIIKRTDERFYQRPLKIHTLFNPYIYNLDILVYTPEEFEKSKERINTIAYTINNTGRIIYESGA